MSGCVNCVWDMYQEELEEWAVAATKAKVALVAQSKAEEPAKRRGRRKKTAVEEGTMSMDDDGGGSETNWDSQLEDAGKSQEELMKGIPIGIREFMRTEKMLKKRHMDEAKAA
jgi:hypothetical protein